ncbi:glycoside hydrolase [Halolactibacillus miurensis]|uniref:Beta-galactosidase n=1 Tax=Halolactibacillus miurensis TaxID=306541 RepID=A0A1I6Q3R1_9BACI|nr:beta-galactosidase [Halolactibacillus miurensis]GEM03312.1 glycoside hydrolase [Halolactibacillus miurensis]SFS47063.1 beta-galactosidase [Halolactibacillus miurensis]
MIEIKQKQIIIDGKPELLMVGEIHYFRTPRDQWENRIEQLKESGCNAVSSYIPWIVHEEFYRDIDLEGRQFPEHDLEAFIDLANDHDLYFFVRPGPFIMAEMKNDGIPYWLYEKYPEVIPVTWYGNQATTVTLDYLAPDFLKEVKRWYEAVFKVVVPRLHDHGGNVIAIQLDNEIGMLSWVSNNPDLTDHVLEQFKQYLIKSYNKNILTERYPFIEESFDTFKQEIRAPKHVNPLDLHKDLGYYMRQRFSEYVRILREFAESCGVSGVPFMVNIHGTGGGRGFTYPIGISQLYESYTQETGYISGSDHYFGNLDMTTFQDLYLINGMMDAVHLDDQPLTSAEFNCGDGNFGETLTGRYDPSAADLKTRMSIAQGNRLLNYYLMTGGYNRKLQRSMSDGNDRIATTGERHGFAAPISPEGEKNYTFDRMATSIKRMLAVKDKLAVMNEEHDDLHFAFIPDYYMTEYHYPDSDIEKAFVGNLTSNRAHASWELLARSIILSGYRFTGIDIQNRPIDVKDAGVLVVPSAKYMSEVIQDKLVAFIAEGGRALFYGELPRYDMEGRPCGKLIQALGVTFEKNHEANQHFYLSVQRVDDANQKELRTHFAQGFTLNGQLPLIKITDTNHYAGFKTQIKKGHVTVLTTPYKADLEFFRNILEDLGVKPGLTHDYQNHGIFTTSVRDKDERFIHILNLEAYEKKYHLLEHERMLFDGELLTLEGYEGVMLPIDININEATCIHYSTCEIISYDSKHVTFDTKSKDVKIKMTTTNKVSVSPEINKKQEDNNYIFTLKNNKEVETLTVYFE